LPHIPILTIQKTPRASIKKTFEEVYGKITLMTNVRYLLIFILALAVPNIALSGHQSLQKELLKDSFIRLSLGGEFTNTWQVKLKDGKVVLAQIDHGPIKSIVNVRQEELTAFLSQWIESKKLFKKQNEYNQTSNKSFKNSFDIVSGNKKLHIESSLQTKSNEIELSEVKNRLPDFFAPDGSR
jgi:hypothetical protein